VEVHVTSENTLQKGALDGIRIVEWAHAHMGPGAGALLSDLGAEVIHIEQPVIGDMQRRFTHVFGANFALEHGRNAIVEDVDRNKKSVAVDLSAPEGKQIIYGLVKKSDIFLTNMRPRAVARQQMDYETLSQHNSRLIYCQGTTYGEQGPEKDSPGLEMMGLARAGILLGSAFKDGPPVYPTVGMIDRIGAIGIAFGILAALVARERYGIGQRLSTSMLGWSTNLQAVPVTLAANTGQDPRPIRREETNDPLWNVYRLKDGTWIALGMIIEGDKFWPKICRAVGRPELAADARFATGAKREENRRELIALLDEIFATVAYEEWDRQVKINDFIATKVNALTDLGTDPQLLENGYIVELDHKDLGRWKYVPLPIQFDRTPVRIHACAPQIGEHNDEVLQQLLGYSAEQVAELRKSKVI
jgi:crotonobetainyl-CoA:carnitine CoA-transferase CaiB-like acyl-CoA transferase